MSKIRNLKYQFKNIIDKSFKEGMDKHSIKKMGKDNSKIYSYADRKNLIDLSSNFANFMKRNHPEIKELKDINSNHIQEFLNTKTSDCSQRTLEQYQSRFRKLETLCNNTYHVNVDYHSVVIPRSLKNGGGKIRTDMLSDFNYNKLLINSTNQNFKNALVLSQNFGLRASECTKLKYTDITENGIKIIDSKGKRSRFIVAENQKQKDIIKDFVNKNGRVCSCKTSSLQQAFNREKKKNGINSSSDFHSSRKAYATNKYEEYRQQGYTVQQSLDKVSHGLGHGANRNNLMKEYICCPLE